MAVSRGRRGEKKKREEAEESKGIDLDADFIAFDEPAEKNDNEENSESEEKGKEDEQTGEFSRDNRSSFYGLLDRQELEYFKNAESMLATNALGPDERESFITNVFAEAKGKELKLATNQICSKLLERLIQLANDEQIQQLVQAFEPFCTDLAFQKFSSHCLEAVIIKGAKLSDCESLILSMADRLGAIAPNMLADTYAAHVFSTLLLTLTGVNEDLRSKKSQLARKYTEIDNDASVSDKLKTSPVSPELKSKAKHLIKDLSSSLSKSDARKMAIDASSSPAMQSVIRVESSVSSRNTLLKLILDPTDSSGFVTHCLSDPVGSHFLEMAVKVMPSRMVKKFVSTLPIDKLATNDNLAAKYLLQTIVLHSHLPVEKKQEIVKNYLLPEVSKSMPVALAALNLDFAAAADVLTTDLGNGVLDLQDPAKAAVFEKLANYPPFVEKAAEILTKLEDEKVKAMCLDPTLSYVVQSLLKPKIAQISRRKLINKLIAIIPQLTVNAYGSHIVDSLWGGCYKLKFARERIANELLPLEESVKHSTYGQKVWKNWQMEKYAHARHIWWQIVKQNEDALRAQIEPDAPMQRNMPPAPQNKVKRRKM